MVLSVREHDFVRYKNKHYLVKEDRDGNPIFLRVYLSSKEMMDQSIIDLENVVKQVNISVSVPLK